MNFNDIVKLEVTPQVINKTVNNTIEKYLYTILNMGYSRTPVELLDNIFMGDFAKNLIYKYLAQQSINIEDYDEIRTDNFQNPDNGWDLKVNNLKIEVKSSAIPKSDIVNNNKLSKNTFQNILNNRDVKVYAKKCDSCPFILPDSLESDIFIQIYFPNAITYKIGFDNAEELYREISKDPNNLKSIIKIQKYYNAYYFGYLTKQDIIDIYNYNTQNNNKSTWSFSWTEAVYWKAPLSQAKNLSDLVHYIQRSDF